MNLSLLRDMNADITAVLLTALSSLTGSPACPIYSLLHVLSSKNNRDFYPLSYNCILSSLMIDITPEVRKIQLSFVAGILHFNFSLLLISSGYSLVFFLGSYEVKKSKRKGLQLS